MHRSIQADDSMDGRSRWAVGVALRDEDSLHSFMDLEEPTRVNGRLATTGKGSRTSIVSIYHTAHSRQLTQYRAATLDD